MKHKHILLVGIFLFFFSGCTKLIEEPKALTEGTFYNNIAELQGAVFAIYDKINLAYRVDRFFINECKVDYGYARSTYVTVDDFKALDPTNISRTGNVWAALYLAIRDANLVIKNAGRAAGDATQINALVAEARFLRAFAYFDLVRLWAGVPLRDENNMQELHVPRADVNDIYKFIEADLQFAVANLPAKSAVEGRPQITAAKAVLAHVYLEMQRWGDARREAFDVIASKDYALVNVTVSDDFYTIFGPDVNGTSEEVFYLKYTDVLGYGSKHAVYAHHPGAPYTNGRGYFGAYTDSERNPVIKNWDDNDLRKAFNLYSWNIGLGDHTLLYKKFIDPDLSNPNETSNDHPAYRYADVLLFYAEAEAKANNAPTLDAMEKLNMVRRRAYGKNPLIASTVDYNLSDYQTLDAFLDLIIKERGYEHMYEGKRFLDLKRMGKLEEVIKNAHNIDVDEASLLWPIPNIEYDYNHAIDPATDQNPGY